MGFTTEQEQRNEEYFTVIFKMLHEGGIYFWPDVKEMYNKVDGKIQPSTKHGYDILRLCVGKEWFQQNVIMHK